MFIGQNSIGARFVDYVNSAQNNGRMVWLKKIGLAGEIGGFIWMTVINFLFLFGLVLGCILICKMF